MTNSEKNKDILSSDELGKNSKKTDDYSSLLEKIRKQTRERVARHRQKQKALITGEPNSL